jgi:hypothetical protein
MSREASKGLTVEALVQQWRTPLGYAPSYNRFMKVLKHLGLSNLQAVTEDGQALIETELLSRKWTKRQPETPALIPAIDRVAIAHVTDELLDLAKQRLFWQQLEVEVLCLGGDPARARAWVEHMIRTAGMMPDRARGLVIERLKQGHEIPDVRE